MPRLTQKGLRDIRYASMVDFSRRFDEFDTFHDKFLFATRYILSHQTVDKPDYTLSPFVHIAKMKLLDASNAMKKEEGYERVGPKGEEKEHELAYEMFLSDPSGYIKGEALKLAQELSTENSLTPEDKKLMERCQRLGEGLDEGFNEDVKRYDDAHSLHDVRARLEIDFGGKSSLANARKAAQPKFLDRLLGRGKGEEAKKLDDAYRAFLDPSSPSCGGKGKLEDAAVSLIQTDFPDYRKGDRLPKEEEFDSLSSSEKPRLEFASAIIRSIDAEKKIEGWFDGGIEGLRNKGIRYEDIEKADAVEKTGPTIDQASFQSDLSETIEEDDRELVEEPHETIPLTREAGLSAH